MGKNNIRKIGIIAAMEVEIALIKNSIQNATTFNFSGIDYICGKIGGLDVVVACCGVGKVFAAMCAQTMILRFRPDAIINIGVSGAMLPNLKIGDVVVANSVVQHDMNTTTVGDPIGMISGINKINFYCDKNLVDLVSRAAEEMEIHHEIGVVATGDLFFKNNKTKEKIKKRFNAIAAEMEGAAVAQVCYVNNVKFAEIRAVSDHNDESSNEEYGNYLEYAAKVSANLMLNSLKLISA